MDIHKPKAAHSLREFLIEIGTIICGILIALGLEQALEWSHWRHAEERAIKAMTLDAENQLKAIRNREEQNSCVESRLAEIKTVLARHDLGAPLGIIGLVGRPFYRTGNTSAWDVAVAEGSVGRLPYEDRDRFARALQSYKLYEGQAFDEKAVWQRLQFLNHYAVLTPQDWSQVRRDHDLATDFNESFRVTIPTYLHRFSSFHEQPKSPITAPFAVALCRPLLATLPKR